MSLNAEYNLSSMDHFAEKIEFYYSLYRVEDSLAR